MKPFLTHSLAFVLGALLISPLSAQINTNEAVYGRMLGSGIATWLATPSSANLASAVTDETGSPGPLVFGANPTITQTAVAVASLPTCNAGNDGRVAFVNNALAPALGVAVAGAGALTVGVICKNGTGWLVF